MFSEVFVCPQGEYLSLVPCSFKGVSVSGPVFLPGVSPGQRPPDRDHPPVQ